MSDNLLTGDDAAELLNEAAARARDGSFDAAYDSATEAREYLEILAEREEEQ